MEITSREDGGVTLVSLKGRLDTNTAPQLEEFANDLFANGKMNLVVDMAECDFVSSAGRRVIVAMQKRVVNDGKLVFKNVQSDVMDVFDMTGFSKILTFE